jgi:hypothetical protein
MLNNRSIFPIVLAVAASLATGCAAQQFGDSLSTAQRTQNSAARDGSPATAPLLFVANASTPSITEYAFNANGDVAPVRKIAGSRTGMGQGLGGITVDATGTTYVSRVDGGILEYGAGANGNVRPIRAITGATSGPIFGFELAVDYANNLYVADGGDIKVFAPGASGVATPLRDIFGPATTIGFVEGVAVDRAGRLFAADFTNVAILVFAAGANGNVAPIARIAGSKTTLAFPRYIGVSADGTMYVSDESEIQIFAPGANGNVPPARAITFTSGTGPYGNVAVARERAILGQFHVSSNWSVDVYRAGLHGGPNPLRVIAGNKTQLSEPVGAAIR